MKILFKSSGLYRGIFPTSQRAMTIAAIELPVYDFCKNLFMPLVGDMPVNHFISSFFASLLAAVASTPIDVIRTRLMNQKRIIKAAKASIEPVIATPVYFSTSYECLRSILKFEGVRALWKGNNFIFISINRVHDEKTNVPSFCCRICP